LTFPIEFSNRVFCAIATDSGNDENTIEVVAIDNTALTKTNLTVSRLNISTHVERRTTVFTIVIGQ
jgi:hypothetical protein